MFRLLYLIMVCLFGGWRSSLAASRQLHGSVLATLAPSMIITPFYVNFYMVARRSALQVDAALDRLAR